MSSLRSGLAGWGAALLFRDERTIIRRSGWLGGHSWPTATGALSSSWDSFSDFTNSLSLLLASSKSRAMVPLNEWPRRSWCSHDIYHNLRAFSNGSGRNYKRQSWLNPRPQESWSPFSCDLDLFLPPLALSWSLGCSPPHTRHSTQFPPEQPQAYSTLHSSTIFLFSFFILVFVSWKLTPLSCPWAVYTSFPDAQRGFDIGLDTESVLQLASPTSST